MATAIEKEETEFKSIDGLVYNYNGKVIVTKSREFIKDLDVLPFPSRELLPLELYSPLPSKESDRQQTTILGSRGYPYNCTFCSQARIWKRKVRFRSPKNIVDEFEECINKYKITLFDFVDDLLTVNRKRVIALCNEIKKRKLDIEWYCQSRADTLDKKMIYEMKSAGCKRMAIGFESGSQRILNSINKQISLEDYKKAVFLLKEAEITCTASFMLGNIGETEETIRQTIKWAKELDLDSVMFNIATPYPETEMYEIASEKGYLKKDIGWEDFQGIGGSIRQPVMNLPSLSAQDILNWRKKAFRSYSNINMNHLII